MIKLLLLLLSTSFLAKEPNSNQSQRIDSKRLQEAYLLMQKTNDTCWTLLEIYKALVFKGNFIKNRSSSDLDKIYSDQLSKVQSSLDKSPCRAKLKELTEEIKQLNATEQQILRDTKIFKHPDFGSLNDLYNGHIGSYIGLKRSRKAINAFYSTDRADQNQDEVNENQPLSLEACKELAKKLDETGSIEDIEQK